MYFHMLFSNDMFNLTNGNTVKITEQNELSITLKIIIHKCGELHCYTMCIDENTLTNMWLNRSPLLSYNSLVTSGAALRKEFSNISVGLWPDKWHWNVSLPQTEQFQCDRAGLGSKHCSMLEQRIWTTGRQSLPIKSLEKCWKCINAATVSVCTKLLSRHSHWK